MTFVLPAVLALVAAASFFSGIFGVAGGMILMGGLVYLLPVSQAMLVHGVAQFVSNGARVMQWRAVIELRLVAWFLGGSAACVAILAFIRFVPSPTLVLFLLGASALAILAVPDRMAPRITDRPVAVVVGFLAAGLMLTAGVSGTFIDQFFARTGLDRRANIATKATMQTVLHAVKIVYFAGVAPYALDEALLLILALVPLVAVVGSRLGGIVLLRMNDKQFYWWTRRIVFCVGAFYVAIALKGMFVG